MVERRTVEDGSFLADGLTGSAPSAEFGTGRVCVEPQCTARLSRYNSTQWCALHESPASTQRPYDTSTRQRGRRRNSSSRRRVTTATSSNSTAGTSTTAGGVPTATSSSSSRASSGDSSASDKSVATKAARRTAA